MLIYLVDLTPEQIKQLGWCWKLSYCPDCVAHCLIFLSFLERCIFLV